MKDSAYLLEGLIDKQAKDKLREYFQNHRVSELHLDTTGGDFRSAICIVKFLLDKKPNVLTVVNPKAFSSGAFIFLSMPNRAIVKGASIFLHRVKLNVLPNHNLLRQKQYYSKLLQTTVANGFCISDLQAHQYIKQGTAFTDKDILKHTKCVWYNKRKLR